MCEELIRRDGGVVHWECLPSRCQALVYVCSTTRGGKKEKGTVDRWTAEEHIQKDTDLQEKFGYIIKTVSVGK